MFSLPPGLSKTGGNLMRTLKKPSFLKCPNTEHCCFYPESFISSNQYQMERKQTLVALQYGINSRVSMTVGTERHWKLEAVVSSATSFALTHRRQQNRGPTVCQDVNRTLALQQHMMPSQPGRDVAHSTHRPGAMWQRSLTVK